MRDAEHILKLIRANRNLDQKVWIAALPKLKARQDRYFMTELGMAFISTLMEKHHFTTFLNKYKKTYKAFRSI